MSVENIGRGVSYEIDGKELVLRFDLGQTPVLSDSGKSQVVASTKGNQSIVIDGKIAVVTANLFVPIPKAS